MAEESIFLLHALWIGVLITLVYDGLIIFRGAVPHNSFGIALEDMGFWFFCAIYVFAWLHRESSGTLRWYAVAGALLGMWIYKKTLSKVLVKLGTRILQKVLEVLRKFLRLITAPLRFMKRKTKILHTKMQRSRKKLLGNCKIKLKSFVKALKIRLCKQ